MALTRAVISLQARRGVEGILEDRQPETSVGGLIEELIVENHVQREHTRAVVPPNRGGAGGEIRIPLPRVTDVVDGPRVPLPSHELVRPQHVVLPSRENGTRDLEREIRAAHVRQRIAVGEGVTHYSADE